MIDLEVEVSVDPSALINQIVSKAAQATMAGAIVLQREHEDIISSWEIDSRPIFDISDFVVEGNSVLRTLRAIGTIWHWVNEGTKPRTITNKYMRFPFQGVGASYSAKTYGGSGERLGPEVVMFTVKERRITPRNLTSRAIATSLFRIIGAMQDAMR